MKIARVERVVFLVSVLALSRDTQDAVCTYGDVVAGVDDRRRSAFLDLRRTAC